MRVLVESRAGAKELTRARVFSWEHGQIREAPTRNSKPGTRNFLVARGETDAPDIPQASRRGERNSPEYLPGVAQTIAQLRGIDVEEIARVTTANAEQLFEFKNWDARVHPSQGTS